MSVLCCQFFVGQEAFKAYNASRNGKWLHKLKGSNPLDIEK